MITKLVLLFGSLLMVVGFLIYSIAVQAAAPEIDTGMIKPESEVVLRWSK